MQTSRAAWLLCWLMFCASALSFLDRQVLSVLAPQLTAEFRMSNTDYSRVIFAFVLSYTVMFSLGGRLMDYLGTRLGLGLSVAFWSLASAAHALAQGPWSLGISRFLLGLGEGSCFPAVTKGATEWFPPERRALAISIANGGSAFGAVIAPPVTGLLAAKFGWRGPFLATALFGALWTAAWFLARGPKPANPGSPAKPQRQSLGELLSNRAVIRAMTARFLFDPVFYFYMFWIPQYLARERGLSVAAISASLWIPFLALGISNMFAGHLSDSLVRRGWPARRARLVLLATSAFLTPASWLASLAGSVTTAIALMSVLMFAHGIWITNFLALLSDHTPPSSLGTAVGLTGTVGGTAGMLSSLAIGPVVDHFSFTPVFAASGIVYPLAFLVLSGKFILHDKPRYN